MEKREIKFRAWDKGENKWLLGYEMESLGGFSMFGEVMMMGEYAELLSSYFPDRLKDIELMQYTGLKDKNGKEIYEGDVVKYLHQEGFSKVPTPKVHAVEFIDGEFWPRVNNYNSFEDYPQDLYDFEIIGNIYQNPELIK